jgi:rRNA maturation endonuclease Nob1
MERESPFQYKTKLEHTCESCGSNYKIVFFEEEVTTSAKHCPFCGEEIDEASTYENSSNKSDSGLIYTDDEGARFESELMDDDL